MGSVTSTWPLAHPVLYLHQRLWPCGSPRGCTSMHFGENQLSPRSIGISPLPTTHPPVLQHGWVRASTDFHIRFTLVMGSSRGFGSTRRHSCAGGLLIPLLRPLQTRFPSGSPPLAGVNPCDDDSLAGSFYKRHAISPYLLLQEWPLTAGKDEGSGSLSSPSRGAFHLSLTVLVHYRSQKIFSLGGWSPQLPTGFHVPRGTQDPCVLAARLSPTGLSPSLVRLSNRFGWPFCPHMCRSYNPGLVETSPVWAASHFARHYSGNLG